MAYIMCIDTFDAKRHKEGRCTPGDASCLAIEVFTVDEKMTDMVCAVVR